MVGVPGRSKGCSTCRKRKVKCDETKPVCTRCQKAYLLCGGYGKRTIFIDAAGRRDYAAQSHTSSAAESHVYDRSGHGSETGPWRSESRSSRAFSATPMEVGPRAFKIDECLACVTSELFPHAGPGGRHGAGTGARSWVLDAIDADSSRVIYKATCSMAAALYARMRAPEPGIRAAGATYYIQALQQLNSNLQDERACLEAANIPAAYMLSMYELSVYNNAYGWMEHCNGLETLIRKRGIDAHRRGTAKKYFFLSRLPILARSIALRRRTFLEDDAWCSIPLTDTGETEPIHQLMDQLMVVPGLLEDTDSLLSSRRGLPLDQMPNSQDLRDKLVGAMKRIFKWRFMWEHTKPNVAYVALVDPARTITLDESGTPIFSTLIFYRDLHQGGRAIMMYNMGILLLLEIATTLHINDLIRRALADMAHEVQPVPTNALTLPHKELTAKEVSTEMLRSIEYHLTGPHRAHGALSMLTPLRTLLRSRQDARTIRWLVKVAGDIPRLSGFEFAERLTDLKSFAGDVGDRIR